MNWKLQDYRARYRTLGLGRLKKSLTALAHWHDRNYEPIFVSGLSGSGNTLLAALLDQEYLVAGLADETALHARFRSCLKIRSTIAHTSLDSYAASLTLPDDLPVETLRSDVLREYRRYTERPKRSAFAIDKAPNSHLVRAARLHAAFPDAHFLVMVRDPYEQMEGLLRKWELYRNAGLAATVRFCRGLIDRFEVQTRDFEDQTLYVTLDDVKQQSDEVLTKIARRIGLEKRSAPKKRESVRNLQGFALRNVRDGEILIDRRPGVGGDAFSQGDRELIDAALRGPYERAVERAARLLGGGTTR